MAKVLYISSTYPDYEGCGTGIYAGYLTKALAEHGHEMHVLTSTRPEIKAAHGKVVVHKAMSHWNLLDLPNLMRVFLQVRPQIIHINHPTRLAADKSKFFTNFIPALMSPHIPVVTTLHEFIHNSTLGKLKVLPMVSMSQAVTVTNQRYKESLLSNLPKGYEPRIHVINIGSQFEEKATSPDPATLRPHWGLDQDDFVIGFVGFITPPKGFKNLLQACASMMQENPKIKILALSSWNLTSSVERYEILKYIKDKNLERQVIFSGYLDDSTLWDNLGCIDIVVFPFNHPLEERSSGPLRQVLSRGLPTIVFALDQAYSEFGFRHGENIWLTPHQDLSTLTDDINTLRLSPQLRKTLSEGTISLKKSFSFDTISNEFSRLYSNLMG